MVSRPKLNVSLNSVASNWKLLCSMSESDVETAAVVKADAYGLGMTKIALELLRCGAREFFVATAKEGQELRKAVGTGPRIFILSGYSRKEVQGFSKSRLVPCVVDSTSLADYIRDFPTGEYALHIETGLNRLAMPDNSSKGDSGVIEDRIPVLILSHLACGDDPHSATNPKQLVRFLESAAARQFPGVRLSLAATEGILLGKEYHLDLTRPGIGLFHGGYLDDAKECVQIQADLIAAKTISAGASVGYGNTWIAKTNTKVAALAMGYADGLPRTCSSFSFFASGDECPVIGRISMDIVNVDITHLRTVPEQFDLICKQQTVSQFAAKIGEIPNSVLTRFGACLERTYI